MTKKILFFDFDGTIISDRTGLIPPSALEILRRLDQAGHILILNTGRTRAILDPITHTLKFHGRILGCGSYVEYCDDTIYQAYVDEAIHTQLLKKLEAFSVEAFLEGSDHLYVTEGITSGRLLHHIKTYKENHVNICPVGTGMEFQKMFIYYPKPEYEAAFRAFISQYFEYIDRGRGCAELVIKHHSKATGIQKILDVLDMTKEDCYVFGDSNNDIPMFNFIKNSILIGGENPELKDMVLYAGADVDHDGLFRAVYECGIL